MYLLFYSSDSVTVVLSRHMGYMPYIYSQKVRYFHDRFNNRLYYDQRNIKYYHILFSINRVSYRTILYTFLVLAVGLPQLPLS